MSLFGAAGNSCHLTISAPSAGAIANGAYTAAVLFKPNLFAGDQMIWRAYQSSNFSQRGLYINGDMWIINQQAVTGIPSIGNPPIWYWFVASRGTAEEAPRAHWADYAESGSLLWAHVDASGIQTNQNVINRLCLGDEFSDSFRGHVACLVAFTTELTDAQIESLFVRNSLDIMNANPDFFVHWPENEGIGFPFEDIAGGGVETIRTGTWDVSADPPGFDFSLARSGKPKVWDGTTWVQHQSKVWNGSMWIPSKMNGADASGWITSK